MADNVEKFLKDDWTDYVNTLAGKIADERQKFNRKVFKTEPSDENREKYAKEYARRILKAYPFDGEVPVEKVYTALESTGNESLMQWLDGNKALDPFKVQEKAKADKFRPLLHGVSPEGSDWYTMGTLPLMKKAAELGYDPSTKEGFQEFLNDVSKYQQQHDRGQLVADMRDDLRYLLGSLAAPTATKAIEEAVATGGDLSPSKAAALAALDVGANTAMWEAPSINFLKSSPILQGVINAVIQGAEEGARQGLGHALADTDVDVSAPFLAASIGATRPGIMGFAQGKASQFQGKNARDFARGIMKSTRAGDPVEMERNEIRETLEQFNRNVDEEPQFLQTRKTKGLGESYLHSIKPKSLSEINKEMRGANASKYTEALDAIFGEVQRNPYDKIKFLEVPRNPYDKINVEGYLQKYDNLPHEALRGVKNGKIEIIDPIDYVNERSEEAANLRRYGSGRPDSPNIYDREAEKLKRETDQVRTRKYFSPKNLQLARDTFPAKMAEAEGDNAWTRAGTLTGKFLADLGGRVEPIIRANPFAGSQAFAPKDYKESSWYKKLDKGSRAILDAAIKSRREELAEDNLEYYTGD